MSTEPRRSTSMTTDPTTDAYVWRCAAGHEVIISELAMRLAVAKPVCVRRTGSGMCGRKLVTRLRPWGQPMSTETERCPTCEGAGNVIVRPSHTEDWYPKTCPSCKGTGAAAAVSTDPTDADECPTCLGTKVESVYAGTFGGSITCRTCGGTGLAEVDPWWEDDGHRVSACTCGTCPVHPDRTAVRDVSGQLNTGDTLEVCGELGMVEVTDAFDEPVWRRVSPKDPQ